MFSLISFIAFTGLVAVVSYLKTHKDDHAHGKSYFLAGNMLTGWVIAGSLMLTNLSTEQLIGLNGNAYTHGAQVIAWEVIAAVGMVVMLSTASPDIGRDRSLRSRSSWNGVSTSRPVSF